MLQKLYVFFRKETVLSIAVILALLSNQDGGNL